MSIAYYNENDPFAAEWLRHLIAQGHIANGDVDDRDMRDVRPEELSGYTQCHFFAGIGVWSYALRNAGWPDSRPVWTGSCPCQPFSSAGKKGGFDDERHLWPDFHYLINIAKPLVVFGEQVASKDGLAWLDLVQADMEGTGYAFGAVDLCAAGVGAPHIRQRLYWTAESGCNGLLAQPERDGREGGERRELLGEEERKYQSVGGSSPIGSLDNATDTRHDDARKHERGSSSLAARFVEPSAIGELGNPSSNNMGRVGGSSLGTKEKSDRVWQINGPGRFMLGSAGPTRGFWAGAEWLPCTDGKARPVEPSTFPLAHGLAGRVGRLRGYGNALNAEVAKEFITAAMQ